MADATNAELIVRVLQKLYVLERGETADATDAALIQGIIDACNADLTGRNVADWEDDEYPQQIFEAFAEYVACCAASDFPSPRVLAQFTEAYKMLKYGELQEFSELYANPTPDSTYATIV